MNETIRIRLWRGPCDGKVLKFDHNPGHTVQVTFKPRYKRGSDKWYEQMRGYIHDPNEPLRPSLAMMYKTALYMRTGFYHPDGSIFYEYSVNPRYQSPGSYNWLQTAIRP